MDVSKSYLSLRGDVPAVRGVDLSVEDGELFVLLGPSGCGKSTVLNLAAGLERPTSGEIRFDGEIVASREGKVFVPPGKRNVAMVFQSYALYPHLDVRENIAFPLRVAGEAREEIDRAVARTAAMLGIEERLRSRPSELSGGQRQRVAIARALVRRPRLFLLDEPLSNLDAALRTSTRAELRKLQRSLEVTTLYVTHDQTEAMTLGDRVALLREGRILQTGTPRDLYENPRTPFAASFIGPYPMNLVKTDVEEEGGACCVRIGTDRFPLSPERASGVRRLGSRKILFGIRPEHACARPESPGPGLRGIVTGVEHLGRETLVTADIGGVFLRAIAGEGALKEGDALRIEIPVESIHVFPETSGAS
ncbi:MAG: ABC transporter ATP-binding protein [Deltaproteobacteria bacterium]|nr:ABC transporter ATP-binding protein [Deltaproteobacteria bacterium]